MAEQRNKLGRLKRRGSYDRALAYSILDEGLVAHVGIVDEEFPVVIPMLYARDGDQLLLHGSVRGRLMRALASGAKVCVTVTLLDGLVLARSAFNHSANYRSVIIFGQARPLRTLEEKRVALDKLVEYVIPGRTADARGGSASEIKATAIVAINMDEFSIKTRSGPPEDKPADLGLAVWAGEVPLGIHCGAPRPAPDMEQGIELPPYLAALVSRGGGPK